LTFVLPATRFTPASKKQQKLVDESIALTSVLVLPRSKPILVRFKEYQNAPLVMPAAHFFVCYFYP